jgi:hypothetical protein
VSVRLLGRAALSGLQAVGPAVAGRRIRKDVPLTVDRRLPLPGEVLVREGQNVEPDTVVARALDVPAKLHLVQVSSILEPPFQPEDVRRAVVVQSGQAVRAGEPLARVARSGWVDRRVQEVTAPVDGVVEFISLGRAQIILRARGEERAQRLTLSVAGHLGVEPAELPSLVLCRPGQRIEAADLLARGPGLRILAGEFRAPVSGVVESISPLTGTITVLQEPRTVTLKAYLRGRVQEVFPGYGVRIGSYGHRVLGVLGLGGKSWGTLKVLDPAGGGVPPSEPARVPVLREADVGVEHQGCVLLFPGEVTAGALLACRRHQVRGVIAASAHANQLSEFIGRPLAAEIVTGPGALALPAEPGARTGEGPAEEPGLTILLTEGLGRLAVDPEVWAVLKGHSGLGVSLDGLTQIRAGVVRPVVLLPVLEETTSAREAGSPQEGGSPQETAPAEEAAGRRAGPGVDGQAAGLGPEPPAPAESVSSYAPPELAAGMRVRLVRSPYFGLWGTVISPPAGLTRLETEVEARVLRVRLEDGREVSVAEANIEI